MRSGRPSLAVVHGADQDQMPRLAAFRAAYPHLMVGTFDGVWQARIREENGETVMTRYLLRDLLDKLGELLGDPRWLAGPRRSARQQPTRAAERDKDGRNGRACVAGLPVPLPRGLRPASASGVALQVTDPGGTVPGRGGSVTRRPPRPGTASRRAAVPAPSLVLGDCRAGYGSGGSAPVGNDYALRASLTGPARPR